MKLKICNPSRQYRRDFWGLRDFSLEAGPGVTCSIHEHNLPAKTLVNVSHLAGLQAAYAESLDGRWEVKTLSCGPGILRPRLGFEAIA